MTDDVLVERIPPQVAMEYALTGDFFSAADAHPCGLVNRVTQPGGALAGAIELAMRITANAPLSIAATKEIIVRSADWSSNEAFGKQMEIMRPVFESADAREGRRPSPRSARRSGAANDEPGGGAPRKPVSGPGKVCVTSERHR
jgi:enoyl-CoA hydratase/carnithine racemase